RAQPDGPLADEGHLPRHLLPQRRDLFRRGDAGTHLVAFRAPAGSGRTALCRPFRAGLRPRPLRDRRPHRLSRQGARMMKPVRVLVVDDSATMRSLIAAVLRHDPAIEVVGEAADPYEAREAIKT